MPCPGELVFQAANGYGVHERHNVGKYRVSIQKLPGVHPQLLGIQWHNSRKKGRASDAARFSQPKHEPLGRQSVAKHGAGEDTAYQLIGIGLRNAQSRQMTSCAWGKKPSICIS